MRLLLQIVSLFLLLCGMGLIWHAIELANQEYFHFFHSAKTYMFQDQKELLKSLILSAVAGVFIFTVSLIMFQLAMHHLRAKAKTLFDIGKYVSAKTSTISLSFLCIVLIIVPAWIWIDACFQPALTWARVDLGIPDEIGQGYIKLNSMSELFIEHGRTSFFEKSHSLSALGPRIGVMIFLLCGTALSILLSLMHSVLNSARKRYLLILTVTLLGIGALIHQQENLLWFSAQRRVANHLLPFQKVVKSVNREWPTTSGTLPEVGKYFAHEKMPGKLYFRNPASYDIAESLGGTVRQLPNGGVSFTLKPHFLFQLEYHPPGSVPLKILHEKSESAQLTRSAEIEEGWFLTQYMSVGKEKGVATKTTEN